MKCEIRADGLFIDGYVNVTGKLSKPVITPHGKCIETVEERAFERAIERAGNINVTVDHNKGHVYASTSDGTLKLYEDPIGLKAEVLIKDEMLIETAKKGKIKGWSFGMYNVIDDLEERANALPLRRIKELDLDHLTLVVNKSPCYAATSVELRAGEEKEIETRAGQEDILVIDTTKDIPKKQFDNSEFRKRINNLKSAN